ncbi:MULTISPECIES: hypothetical protein [Rhizobium/Agrobacterium group]|uniref:hypothetical protein n=1 Tax=Rhizobium/Agrobacterium group TaxID=227290 RepID=UPI000A5AC489|nr:hypothetical protein [Rhizobium sp. Root483D2]
MMTDATLGPENDLRDIVEAKLASLVLELEEANFKIDEIAFAIEDVLKANWLDQATALRRARAETPENFVSDGNEG